MDTTTELDTFTKAYLTCALWASTDENDEPYDKEHSIEDFALEALNKAITDCKRFQESNSDLLLEYSHFITTKDGWTADDYAGYDFWLTRNGHGAGFWDRDGLPDDGKGLTEACKSFRECDVYTGDDGKLYLS